MNLGRVVSKTGSRTDKHTHRHTDAHHNTPLPYRWRSNKLSSANPTAATSTAAAACRSTALTQKSEVYNARTQSYVILLLHTTMYVRTPPVPRWSISMGGRCVIAPGRTPCTAQRDVCVDSSRRHKSTRRQCRHLCDSHFQPPQSRDYVTIRPPPLICPEDDLRAAAGLTTTYRMAQNKQDYLTFRPS